MSAGSPGTGRSAPVAAARRLYTRLLDWPVVLSLRSSFRTKLLLGLLASVAVLAAVTLLVVRSETSRQIAAVSRLVEARSREAFIDLEEYNRAQLSQLSTVFTGSVQAAAALEGAIEAGDYETLARDVDYEFEARRIPHTLVAFTDSWGEPVLAMLNRHTLEGADPVGVRALAERVLDGDDTQPRGYRAVHDSLFSIETMLLDLGRPVGTVTIGVPITDADAQRLGNVIGAEVCFVVDERCIAGTPRARAELSTALASMGGRQRSEMASAAGERWRVVSDRLVADDDLAWRVIAVPLDPVIAPFERVQNAMLLGGFGALFAAVLIATLLSRSLTKPVQSLVSATSRIGGGDYDARVDVRSVDELGVLGRAFNEMALGLALKERYRGLLDKVVSHDIAEELLKGDVQLGGENREVTTVFADITGFTSLTDGMEPAHVIALLNECMELLSNVVEAEGGVVDKYVGDEIMALFGAPVARTLDPLRAARAALGMQRAMRTLNADRAVRGEAPIEISIGLNTGVAMAGNMGSSNRLNYTVLGDAVNLAARLEQLARSDQILMSEHTMRHVADYVTVRDDGLRELRGFAQPVRVYELLGLRATAPVPDAVPVRASPAAAASAERTASGSLATILLMVTAVVGPLLAAALVATAPLLAAALVATAPLHAQRIAELPTLERFHHSSSSGWFQAGLSGRLDIDGYLPQDDPAWIIPSTTAFVAPRLRLFGDAFFGERVLASAELRVDRGEEPAAGPMDARIDQLFVRVTAAPAFAVQAGKFVSPLGGWIQRHHTNDDPFVRPPLHYDHRTVLAAGMAPGAPAGFLTWKDRPAEFRATGAPVIWGAPYQWGAQVMGAAGVFSWRAAAVNSAPSSEPEEWGLDRGFDAPSFIVNAGMQVVPSLRVEITWNEGPWMREDATGLAAGRSADQYDQRLIGAELVFRLARTVLRSEFVHDTWAVPNVGYNVTDVSWYAEGEQTLSPTLSLAARYGQIRFLDLTDDYSGTAINGGAWDYDVSRLQLGAGYRVARNAGIKGEVLLNGSAEPDAPRNNLFAVQLWWAF